MIDTKTIQKYTKDLKVLYVEDDKEFAKDALYIFDNFFSHIDFAIDGEDGLEKYITHKNTYDRYHDIVISDVHMPKINGLELTKHIYELNKDQSVIIISAHNEADYLINFINIGLEHFIVKPFGLNEILSVLYNSSKKIYDKKLDNASTKITISDNYSWDTKDNILFYKDTPITLTKKEKLLLKTLIDNKNKISTNEYILYTVWNNNIDATTEMLNPIISRLRKKLPQKLIKSIYGVGYIIEECKGEEN